MPDTLTIKGDPTKTISKVSVRSSGRVAATVIETEDGARLLVSDLKLRMQDGLWFADLTLSPTGVAIEAQIGDVVTVCRQCQREMKVQQ